jgi:glycosyltransferase involved in cell wall biosynthesis
MKIAWFTPFSQASAIGRFSRSVTRELAKNTEIDIWHPETERPHATELRRIVLPSSISCEMLAPYDLVVYNLGDHLPNHGDIFMASQITPGIVILHDYVMHHFFAGYYFAELKDTEEYLKLMTHLYGARGRVLAQEALVGNGVRIWEKDEVIEFPLFEAALRGAYGVVVHSQFFAEHVRKVYRGPMRTIPLAYDAERPSRVYSRLELRLPERDLLLLTIGHVNSNKRIDSVLDVLGSRHDLNIQYVIAGPLEGPYYERLLEKVRHMRLEDRVTFTGYVSEDKLKSYLLAADICLNLRYPAMEGGSASAIEEMLFGKAVVVTDTGCYRDLPDECVWKIRPDRENEDLIRMLEAWAGNPSLRRSVGERARHFAEKTFAVPAYARVLSDLFTEVLEAQPVLQLTDKLARELAQMGVSPDSDWATSLPELFCTLFFRT